MEDIIREYFKGNDFAYTVWKDKYALKDEEGNLIEQNPDETIRRVAKEFYKYESRYKEMEGDNSLSEEDIYELMKDFKYIIPGGSVLSGCGSKTPVSLSNCFVIDSPEDTYDSIMETRNRQVQLMKRRGGVGLDISKLRPRGSKVNNAAITSTGAASFMDGFSSITNEVAQNGRRGALMLTINVQHPDVLEFIEKKQDLTKVTGANISVKVTDEFMRAVKDGKDFLLRFPVELDVSGINLSNLEYNTLTVVGNKQYVKKINAREFWKKIVHCAWNTAEPGIIFVDKMHNYAPDGCYDEFRMVSTNPCLTGDMKVAVADGRGYVSIKELAESGNDVPVYCLDDKHKLTVSLMRNPRVTGYDQEILVITLENGHEIKCTPNHKILLSDNKYVEAENLKEGDSIFLMAYNQKNEDSFFTITGDKKQYFENKLIRTYIEKGVETFSKDSLKKNINICEKDYSSLNMNILEQVKKAIDNGYNFRIEDEKVMVCRECEMCGEEFWVPFDKREISFCSSYCSNEYLKSYSSKYNITKENNGEGLVLKIVSIEKNTSEYVYNGTVDTFHNFFVGDFNEEGKILSINNLQCGEIGMSGGDSCRLIAVNLDSFVVNPYTEEAMFDYDKLYRVAYKAQKLGDDLVDMEIDAVNRILDTVDDKEGTEAQVWKRALYVGANGRRTGTGFLGLGDVIAKLGLKFDSDESVKVISRITKTMFEAELDSSISMAETRGCFPKFSAELEKKSVENKENDLFVFIKDNYPKQWEAMQKIGRRNISWSTVAPTGTISNLAQTTSGIEPLFFPYYERKKKCMNETDRVDFVDRVGEKFTKYVMVHKGLKDWAHIHKKLKYEDMDKFTIEEWKPLFKESPYFGSTAGELDHIARVKIQSKIQQHITHSLSSTCNLPNDITEDKVSEIYFAAWENGCKGITIYRDGCRDNVISELGKKKETEKFFSSDIRAPKRPKTLDADFYTTKVKGEVFYVMVGLYEERPYEVFVYNASKATETPKTIEPHRGKITKISKNKYNFVSDYLAIEDISSDLTTEELSTALYSSMLLRHGAGLKYIIKTARKVDDNIASFTAAMTRILSKYLPKETLEETCPECGGKLVREGGCIHCLNCSYSKCS